jgi:hypothetical protein
MDVREYIGAREYGEIIGKHYRTVIRNYKEGLIDGYTNEAGRVYIRNPNYNKDTTNLSITDRKNNAILYARISNRKDLDLLNTQIQNLRKYAESRGLNVVGIYKEVSPDLSDNRIVIDNIMKRRDFGVLLIEHKKRLTFFNFAFIEKLFNQIGVSIEISNPNDKDKTPDYLKDETFEDIILNIRSKKYNRKFKKYLKNLLKEEIIEEVIE